jgi:HD-like signal output (HDOD) protein
VALTNLDDESRLPEDFWDVTTSLALAASTLAPRFGERPQDALCMGLIAQMGAALLFHNDPEGYAQLVADQPTYAGRRCAELARYGISALRLTAVALEQWSFPLEMILPLKKVDDLEAPEGHLLRAGFEIAARLYTKDYQNVPMLTLTGGRLSEQDLPPVLHQVWCDADEMRRAMLGD